MDGMGNWLFCEAVSSYTHTFYRYFLVKLCWVEQICNCLTPWKYLYIYFWDFIGVQGTDRGDTQRNRSNAMQVNDIPAGRLEDLSSSVIRLQLLAHSLDIHTQTRMRAHARVYALALKQWKLYPDSIHCCGDVLANKRRIPTVITIRKME